MLMSRVTALGASLVWSVDSTRCRERRLDRDLRRLAVANLADEHHVGILAHDRARRRRERESRLFIHLHLNDPR